MMHKKELFLYKNKKLFVENQSAVKKFSSNIWEKESGCNLNNLKLGMKFIKSYTIQNLSYIIIGRFICNNMYCFDNVKSYEIVII